MAPSAAKKESPKKSKSSSSSSSSPKDESDDGLLERLFGASITRFVYASLWSVVAVQIFLKIVYEAYDIRLHAIKEYGMLKVSLLP